MGDAFDLLDTAWGEDNAAGDYQGWLDDEPRMVALWLRQADPVEFARRVVNWPPHRWVVDDEVLR